MREHGKWIAATLLLATAGAGCLGGKKAAPLAPPDGRTPGVAGARWIWDRDALAEATAQAAGSPLVARALGDAGEPALPLVRACVVRADGMLEDGTGASITILPFAADGDRSRATFVSLLRVGGDAVAERSDLIAGRRPFDDEEGFEPIVVGGATIWVRTGTAYGTAPGGDAAGARVPASAEISKRTGFIACLVTHAGQFRDLGAKLAADDAPDIPHAAAIGGGAGLAAAALYCALVTRYI
ncbi:MAG: hypothetical protein ACM3JJ_11420 [Hyphomicrobiales bacterium]